MAMTQGMKGRNQNYFGIMNNSYYQYSGYLRGDLDSCEFIKNNSRAITKKSNKKYNLYDKKKRNRNI